MLAYCSAPRCKTDPSCVWTHLTLTLPSIYLLVIASCLDTWSGHYKPV